MRLQYTKHNFNIYKAPDGFIVHNIKKNFEDGHTHLQSFNTGKYLIELAFHKSIPRHLDRYHLISLIRISDDEEYQRKVEELLKNKKKKQRYINRM